MHPVSNSKREFPISDRRVDENLEHSIRDAVKDDRAVIYPFQVVDFLLESSSRINTVSYSSTRGINSLTGFRIPPLRHFYPRVLRHGRIQEVSSCGERLPYVLNGHRENFDLTVPDYPSRLLI